MGSKCIDCGTGFVHIPESVPDQERERCTWCEMKALVVERDAATMQIAVAAAKTVDAIQERDDNWARFENSQANLSSALARAERSEAERIRFRDELSWIRSYVKARIGEDPIVNAIRLQGDVSKVQAAKADAIAERAALLEQLRIARKHVKAFLERAETVGGICRGCGEMTCDDEHCDDPECGHEMDCIAVAAREWFNEKEGNANEQ